MDINSVRNLFVETSIGKSKLDLSQLKDGIVNSEKITQESIESTDFSYWDSNGNEKFLKIIPSLTKSSDIYKLLLERVLKTEDYISIETHQ